MLVHKGPRETSHKNALGKVTRCVCGDLNKMAEAQKWNPNLISKDCSICKLYVATRAQLLRLSWWNINNPAAPRNGFRTYGHRKEINFTLPEGDTKFVPPSEGN